MTKLLITILILPVVIVLGCVALAYSGFYNVGATVAHNNAVGWFLSTASHASVERRARTIQVPDLSDAKLKLAGANDYKAMCVSCHGAPGRDPQAQGLGLNPAPPDLAESAERMTPAELFWVTKHGIRMTGMPAWGATHDDDALWPVVAFMTALPQLSPNEYQALLKDATDVGHHAPGSSATPPAKKPAHDHSAHSHD